MRTKVFAHASLLVAMLAVRPAPAADWPDWRGPRRDGTWDETGLVTSFAGSTLSPVWSVPVGPGYSGPTVAAGRVYLTDRSKEPVERERVLCVDARTGKTIWEHAYDCTYRKVGYPAGPRASVVAAGDEVYSLGTMGHLYCLDASRGEVRWHRNLLADFDLKIPTWGIAASPLIEGDQIFLHVGGRPGACVVALDRDSGQERWRALDDKASYAAPIMITQAGRRVLVVWTGERVAGLDPMTGQVLWQQPFELNMAMAIASPVWHRDQLFVSSFFNGSMLLQLDPDKTAAEVVWQRGGENERKTDALHACISTPVLLGDHIYGVCSYGELRCLERATGNRVWEDDTAVKHDRWANIHFVRNGEQTWLFNEHGELIISRLASDGFHEISRAKLIEPTTEQLNRKGQGVTWSHPAFANGHVYARSDRELVCVDLRKKP